MLVIVAAALFFRLPHLGDRPFHGDEAVHAVKFRELREQGRYRYDPNEYHGPTLYYAALPLIAAQGLSYADTREADYRLPIALLGAAMILLYLLLRDGIGVNGVLWASLLTAISAPFIFYSRYFIQEMALVAFTLLMIGCGWRYCVTRRARWMLGAAVAAGLTIATKETCVLTFAAMFLAWMVARIGVSAFDEGPGRGGRSSRVVGIPGVERSRPSPTQAGVTIRSGFGLVLVACAVAVLIAYVLLSGFFSHPAGPLGYFETYLPWLKRAGGTDLHRHPWHYYLSLLAWSQSKNGAWWTELPILLLALVGATAGISRAVASRAGADLRFTRFILAYSVTLTAIYSLIPYKTPWNLMSFYLGWVILAGVGAAVLLSLAPRRAAVPAAAVLLILTAGPLGWQARRMTFDFRDDQPGPYAYAQPTRGLREIEERIDELTRFSPQKDETVVQLVFRDDYYWPLPWTLRRLKNVGYWSGAVPEESQARLKGTPILLSSSDFDEALTARLNETHFMIGFHTLREGVLVQAWVKNELWVPFVNSRPKPIQPDDQ